jgi:hypothetical protein
MIGVVATWVAGALLAAVPATTSPDLPVVQQQAAPAAESGGEAWSRVSIDVLPVLGLTSNSWGGLTQIRAEHHFRAPLVLGVELAPLALASSGEGMGVLAQARVHAAFSTRYLAVGLGLGGQLQRFGRNGLSIAPTLRLGRLDGLELDLEYAYNIAPNRYTGQRTLGFSDLLATGRVPLTNRLALQLQAGLNLPAWIFTTVGLRHRLTGDGGPGSWFVSAGLGAAWIEDRSACDQPDLSCGSTAMTFGPTIGFGAEHRF